MSACRDCCAAAAEPLAGSAGPLAAWLGIAWPKPLWHAEEAIDSEGLPPALRELADAYAESGAKLALRLFQREAKPPVDRVEVLLWRPGGGGGRRAAVPLADVPPLISRFLAGNPLDLDPLEHELLVCTDGKHDPCCARFGRPVYDALRAAAAGLAGRIRVAECSHLGGHRFAANCLALPSGDFYGRLGPQDCPGLLEAVGAGRAFLPRLRGSLGRAPLEEAARVFLHEHCGATEAEIEGPGEASGPELRVPARIRTAKGEEHVFVRCVARVYRAPTSCGDEPVDTKRWVPTAVERSAMS